MYWVNQHPPALSIHNHSSFGIQPISLLQNRKTVETSRWQLTKQKLKRKFRIWEISYSVLYRDVREALVKNFNNLSTCIFKSIKNNIMKRPDSYLASKWEVAHDRPVRADGLFKDDHSVFQIAFFWHRVPFSWSFSFSISMNQMLGYCYQFEVFNL